MSRNPLSLKDRLAALTSPTAAPSNSALAHLEHAASKPPVPKRRPFFNPLPQRRNSQASRIMLGEEQLQEVMGRLIFQAGVDFETRPMVIMCASALPDPKEVNYDLLLSRILAYLDLYVESDYTVVFFAAGGKHTPGWNWVWKAYRSLSRKYRKNLKRLYIVHPSFFTKTLLTLAGAMISPKFFRKITYVPTLSDLARQVPITQIDITPAAYQENLKYEKQIRLPVPQRASLFGVPLEELMGYDGEKGAVPRVVKDCVQYLRETGMLEQGLFRRSPSSAVLNLVKEAYDRGHVVTLEKYQDPHLAAVLLKKYLRDLPEPLFPEVLYPIIRQCPPPSDDPADMAAVQYIRDKILPSMAPCAEILLSCVLHLLHEVSLRSATNLMTAYNLSLVISPNLCKGRNPLLDVEICKVPGGPNMGGSIPFQQGARTGGKTSLGQVIQLCIQRYYEVFDDLHDRSDALPPPPHQPTIDDPSPTRSTYRLSMASQQSRNRDSMIDDDDDIDDGMLVMPLGPNARGNGGAPPSAWGIAQSQATPSPRLRDQNSNSRDLTASRSMHTTGMNSNASSPFGTVGRARSTISVKYDHNGASRKGSISIGRGTTKKASGSGVEAMGVTASGFFSPPGSAPPVPRLPGQ